MADDRRFLIRVTVGESDRVDANEVHRVVEYLGGIATDDSFEFPSDERRATALKLLEERFGRRYFQLV